MKKRRGCMKDKSNEFATDSENKIFGDLYREINK
jgi:hypothetical protein